MLTVDFERFPIAEGDRLLDLGCGAGRHAAEACRRGATVVALDMSAPDLKEARDRLGEVDAERKRSLPVQGDALRLPFADGTFDRIIAAEVLEHIPADEAAMAELARVLRPGGLVAVTVPRWGPEKVCWALSDAYHEVEGGHVRIYRKAQLRGRLEAAGLQHVGHHYAHALHAPYWWLRCMVGVHDDGHRATKLYHRLLVWDMMAAPRTTRTAERALNPLIGKSLVCYLRKAPREQPLTPPRETRAAA
ncbi:MAG TPA: class I SAM-dependent methyltransferase [Frankiaceae bacterium]|nr:class I SAM-dependent methyltransferase [Frankiaceae bacterium]